MDLSVFFEKIPEPLGEQLSNYPEESLSGKLEVFWDYFPAWQEAGIVLIGGRHPLAEDATEADDIRRELYALSAHHPSQKIADLGNLKPKDSYEEYLHALAYVVEYLLKNDKLILIIGGEQSQTWAQFQAYKNLLHPVSYVQVDKKFDLDYGLEVPDYNTYNRLILEENPRDLANFTNLGYQRFEVMDNEKAFLTDRYFAAQRLGLLNKDLKEAEPELRVADMVSFDLSVLRFAEAPGARRSSPAGLDAIQACTLARYAGMGYRLSSFCLSELQAHNDIRKQGAKMAAMILWYFLEGRYNQWEDYPAPDRANLRKYAVQLNATVEEIPFYKHPHSERWWMEVPHPDSLGKKMAEYRLVPCSEKDYDFAKTDNIPERWWLAYYRMMT